MTRWNVDRIAKELGINPATLWRWRKAGKFPEPTKKDGREYLWDKKQIEPYFNNGAIKIDELKMATVKSLDGTLDEFQTTLCPDDNYLTNTLARVQYTRNELSRRLGISRHSTFEDIVSEIDTLKNQLDRVKRALG